MCAPVPTSCSTGAPLAALLARLRFSCASSSGAGGVKVEVMAQEPPGISDWPAQVSAVTEKPAEVLPPTV